MGGGNYSRSSILYDISKNRLDLTEIVSVIVSAEKHKTSPGRCPHYCLGPMLQAIKYDIKQRKLEP